MTVIVRVIHFLNFHMACSLLCLIPSHLPFLTTLLSILYSKFLTNLPPNLIISLANNPNIVHHSLLLAHPLQLIPSIPLTLADKVKHLRLLSCAIALRGLLVEPIDLQFCCVFGDGL